MKNLVTITKGQAVSMFSNYKKEVSASGVAFSNITYLVDESKSKTVGGKKMLQKMVETNATIGSDYAKKVNRIAKDKQGMEIDFVAQPMKGKEYVSKGNPVCMDTKTEQKRYLVFIVEQNANPKSQLILNGKEVKREDVWNETYITPAGLKPSATAGRGIVNEENNFFFRTLDFDNLISFNMNGNKYLIVD
jgi:hypothetical protein